MCHRWWRRGERAPGTRQIGYQWAYIFSAVRPDTGDDVTLVMPSVNAKVMDVNGGAKLVHPGGAKLVHLMLCGTRCWGVVPVVHRRDPRCFV